MILSQENRYQKNDKKQPKKNKIKKKIIQKNYLHVVLLYLYLVRHAKGFLAVERGTGAGGGLSHLSSFPMFPIVVPTKG